MEEVNAALQCLHAVRVSAIVIEQGVEFCVKCNRIRTKLPVSVACKFACVTLEGYDVDCTFMLTCIAMELYSSKCGNAATNSSKFLSVIYCSQLS